ncbi:MAG: type I-F CRISPR-associated protein Csy1 [Sulfurovum sp.]|nr:type I-F CRISPR-associated protein Csy1 [Sulfurovum sp.]
MDDKEYQSMADVIKAYINERRDNKEVVLLKDKPKKNVGGINYKLEEAIKKAPHDKKKLEEITKKKKNKNQSALSFQQEKMKELILLAEELNLDIQPMKNEYFEKTLKLGEEHDVINWLSNYCKKAIGVSFATHVIKMTHSSISGASNVSDTYLSRSDRFVTTSSLNKLIVDNAVDDAKNAPVADLLKLETYDSNGNIKTLMDYIKEDNSSPFESFTNDRILITTWMNELKEAFSKTKNSSNFLAKQVYFPVDKNQNYHLILPMTSSSLNYEIHQRFEDAKNNNKVAKSQKKKGKYSVFSEIYFPNKAIIKSVASNPQNVSKLIGKTRGGISLLSSKPPVWNKRLHPPSKKESLFYTDLGYKSRESIKNLQKLLMAIKINERSKNDPKIHSKITLLANEIIDVVFDYVQSIQALKDEAGWSENSALKEAHQLWLDPYRDDEEFQKKRSQKEWHQEIGHDFSMWLNKQLEHKKMIPGNQLQRLWKDIFAPRFREFYAISEVTL